MLKLALIAGASAAVITSGSTVARADVSTNSQGSSDPSLTFGVMSVRSVAVIGDNSYDRSQGPAHQQDMYSKSDKSDVSNNVGEAKPAWAKRFTAQAPKPQGLGQPGPMKRQPMERQPMDGRQPMSQPVAQLMDQVDLSRGPVFALADLLEAMIEVVAEHKAAQGGSPMNIGNFPQYGPQDPQTYAVIQVPQDGPISAAPRDSQIYGVIEVPQQGPVAGPETYGVIQVPQYGDDTYGVIEVPQYGDDTYAVIDVPQEGDAAYAVIDVPQDGTIAPTDGDETYAVIQVPQTKQVPQGSRNTRGPQRYGVIEVPQDAGSQVYAQIQVPQSQDDGSRVYAQIQVPQSQDDGSQVYAQIQVPQSQAPVTSSRQRGSRGNQMYAAIQIPQDAGSQMYAQIQIPQDAGSQVYAQIQVPQDAGSQPQDAGSQVYAAIQVPQPQDSGSQVYAAVQVPQDVPATPKTFAVIQVPQDMQTQSGQGWNFPSSTTSSRSTQNIGSNMWSFTTRIPGRGQRSLNVPQGSQDPTASTSAAPQHGPTNAPNQQRASTAPSDSPSDAPQGRQHLNQGTAAPKAQDGTKAN